MSRWQCSPCRRACSIPRQNWTPNRSDWGRSSRGEPIQRIRSPPAPARAPRTACRRGSRPSGPGRCWRAGRAGPRAGTRWRTATAGPGAQQLVLQRLQRHDLPAGLAQMVVDHVDQAHSAFVDVEDLEPVADPVSHPLNARHGRISSSQDFGAPCRARASHRVHYTFGPGTGSGSGGDLREKITRKSGPAAERPDHWFTGLGPSPSRLR